MEETDTASVQKETGVPRAPLGLRDILQGPQKAGVKLSGRTGAPLWAPPPASLSSRSSGFLPIIGSGKPDRVKTGQRCGTRIPEELAPTEEWGILKWFQNLNGGLF